MVTIIIDHHNLSQLLFLLQNGLLFLLFAALVLHPSLPNLISFLGILCVGGMVCIAKPILGVSLTRSKDT